MQQVVQFHSVIMTVPLVQKFKNLMKTVQPKKAYKAYIKNGCNKLKL